MKKADKRKYLTAKEWWQEYRKDAGDYRSAWKRIFNDEFPEIRKSRWGEFRRAVKNITRIPGDLIRLRRSGYKHQETGDLTAEVRIESRRVVLDDFKAGLVTGENLPVYRALAENETATEVNCRNIVRIKGMTLGQFYRVLAGMGINIRPFFSEYKGENGGRFVVDNDRLNDLPGVELDEERDKYFLAKMFPEALPGTPWSEWTNSRTHGVIYVVRGKTGETELLVPVHVDAENAFVAIKEILTGKNHRGIPAIEYHRMPEQQGAAYVGAGLGELGCLVLVGWLRKAEKAGIVRKVRVLGLEKLSTTGSIAGDDTIMWQIYLLVRQNIFNLENK